MGEGVFEQIMFINAKWANHTTVNHTKKKW